MYSAKFILSNAYLTQTVSWNWTFSCIWPRKSARNWNNISYSYKNNKKKSNMCHSMKAAAVANVLRAEEMSWLLRSVTHAIDSVCSCENRCMTSSDRGSASLNCTSVSLMTSRRLFDVHFKLWNLHYTHTMHITTLICVLAKLTLPKWT